MFGLSNPKNIPAFLLMAVSVLSVVSCETNKDFVETAYDLNMKMIYVPGGQFYMGGTNEQAEFAQEDEIVRQVTLDGYYIAQYEVTQSQWKKVMGTSLSEQRDLSDSDTEINGVGADCAMYYVSWDEAKEFVKKLRDRTGLNYVLPTEAQWEFAARGGSKGTVTVYAGGNDADAVSVNIENSDNSVHTVGEKQPNEIGLYDMSGNVYEWCEDYYGDYEHFFGADNETASHNPKGPKTGFDRVLRGGCYMDEASSCRVSARYYDEPSANSKLYGFRVALIPANADNSVEETPSGDLYATTLDGEIVYDQTFKRVLGVGQTVDFDIDFSDGKNHKIFWISEYPAIADVDESGNVLGIKPGATRIAAFDSNGNIVDMISIFVDLTENMIETGADVMEQVVDQVESAVNNVVEQVAKQAATVVNEVVEQSEKTVENSIKKASNVASTTTFTGNIKNGFPSGTGTLTFKKDRRIDMHDEKGRIAHAGDYIIGEWDRGHLVQGRWYDSSNNLKETIILGKASNPELDSSLGTSSK